MNNNFLKINKKYKYTPNYLQDLPFILNQPTTEMTISSFYEIKRGSVKNNKDNMIISNKSFPYECEIEVKDLNSHIINIDNNIYRKYYKEIVDNKMKVKLNENIEKAFLLFKKKNYGEGSSKIYNSTIYNKDKEKGFDDKKHDVDIKNKTGFREYYKSIYKFPLLKTNPNLNFEGKNINNKRRSSSQIKESKNYIIKIKNIQFDYNSLK